MHNLYEHNGEMWDHMEEVCGNRLNWSNKKIKQLYDSIPAHSDRHFNDMLNGREDEDEDKEKDGDEEDDEDNNSKDAVALKKILLGGVADVRKDLIARVEARRQNTIDLLKIIYKVDKDEEDDHDEEDDEDRGIADEDDRNSTGILWYFFPTFGDEEDCNEEDDSSDGSYYDYRRHPPFPNYWPPDEDYDDDDD